jgi:hypothetical protein
LPEHASFVATLIPELAGFGLAVAFTSPGSVVTMIALLSMSSGPLKRGLSRKLARDGTHFSANETGMLCGHGARRCETRN